MTRSLARRWTGAAGHPEGKVTAGPSVWPDRHMVIRRLASCCHLDPRDHPQALRPIIRSPPSASTTVWRRLEKRRRAELDRAPARRTRTHPRVRGGDLRRHRLGTPRRLPSIWTGSPASRWRRASRSCASVKDTSAGMLLIHNTGSRRCRSTLSARVVSGAWPAGNAPPNTRSNRSRPRCGADLAIRTRCGCRPGCSRRWPSASRSTRSCAPATPTCALHAQRLPAAGPGLAARGLRHLPGWAGPGRHPAQCVLRVPYLESEISTGQRDRRTCSASMTPPAVADPSRSRSCETPRVSVGC
jgi:hypothetical protein